MREPFPPRSCARYLSVRGGEGHGAGAGTGPRRQRERLGGAEPPGIPEGGSQEAARGGGRGGAKGGLGARRAVTAARRGGASRSPARSHGERPRRGGPVSARVRSSAWLRRPGAQPAAAPARPQRVTPARHGPDAP